MNDAAVLVDELQAGGHSSRAARAPRQNWVCFVIFCCYFSPRLLCRFDLAVRAISIRRRIASEQESVPLPFGLGFNGHPVSARVIKAVPRCCTTVQL
jgi:hypothetical protein